MLNAERLLPLWKNSAPNKTLQMKDIAKSTAEEKQEKIAAMKKVSQEVKKAEEEERAAKTALHDLLIHIPNPADSTTPEGGEDDFTIVKKHGEKPTFSFEPKEHIELGEALGIIDTARGRKSIW